MYETYNFIMGNNMTYDYENLIQIGTNTKIGSPEIFC